MQPLFYGIFILILLLPFHLEGDTFENIEVNYINNGQHLSVTGKKVGYQYIFNSNSEKILRLATLNWPPYISEEQCNMGWVFQLTVAMLVSKGYQVRIQFLPWKRAVRAVELGDHDILFPEYFFDETVYSDNVKNTRRRNITILSDHFDGGLLSLVKLRGVNDPFSGDLSILKNSIFGVVRGYQNTPEFDQMVANGQLKTIEAGDELQLVRMLLAKRVDYIVVDPKVLDYMIKNSPLSKIEKIRMLTETENVEPALQYNYLYYAISKKSDRWLEIQEDINAALVTFKDSAEIQRMIKTNEQCVDKIYK
ncbi:transporter substrate-binding domain-containing protein [Colwellia sp. Arc7-635]|uniref:substrate-binding periplasmic protein n=1 Tax=Colwellia sp. Arc7-635 TaxID=2497879 RepID=UPI000F856FCF|nr:transporter substrate-binding domain-containing protein [Colwellia sp. Arc7-635]AZQ83092.1 transporter substrate-binding domain-containing protein [Colwellia sp. Arc7-635]